MKYLNKEELLMYLKKIQELYEQDCNETFLGTRFFNQPGATGKKRKTAFDQLIIGLKNESDLGNDNELAFCRVLQFYFNQPSSGRLMGGLMWLMADVFEMPDPNNTLIVAIYLKRKLLLESYAKHFLNDRKRLGEPGSIREMTSIRPKNHRQ